MPQCDHTINILQYSRRKPNLSSHASLFGNRDFKRSSLAPPGTRVVFHKKTDQQEIWGPRGVVGLYIGHAKEHYRCHKCYIPSTNRVRYALTVEWYPKQSPLPKVTTKDYLRQTASDMLAILSEKDKNKIIPSLDYGSDITNAYAIIASYLNHAMQHPNVPTAPLPPQPATVTARQPTPATTSQPPPLSYLLPDK